MKLNLAYGTGVIVLPGAVFPDHMPPDASYLHVLIAVCANTALLADTDALYEAVAAQCRLPAALVRNAVAYWMECGVLTAASDEAASGLECAPDSPAADPVSRQERSAAAAPAETETASGSDDVSADASAGTEKKTPRAALPRYPAEEYSRILTESDGLRDAIDECARIAGKLFSEHETGQLIALYDSYALSCEFLMLLFSYCKNQLGKTAVSYVVRTGVGLYDDGIRTVEALDAHIAAKERLRNAEYQIRRLLGLGERALTAKEKEYINAWTNVYAMPMDVIERAYEITVKNIDTPRMSYINKILSGWNENGIRTTEAVDAAEAEFERRKAGKSGTAQNAAAGGKDAAPAQNRNTSYDIDTFITLAMNRSFEDTD